VIQAQQVFELTFEEMEKLSFLLLAIAMMEIQILVTDVIIYDLLKQDGPVLLVTYQQQVFVLRYVVMVKSMQRVLHIVMMEA
jgi:hypothetical protein